MSIHAIQHLTQLVTISGKLSQTSTETHLPHYLQNHSVFHRLIDVIFPMGDISYKNQFLWVSLVAQTVKNLPAMQKTWVQFLGLEDSLEEGMATKASILAWKIPWIEDPGGLQSMGSQGVGHY